MEANTYVGLDIHRKSIVATALDARGETVGEAKIGPTTTELTAFLRGLPGTKHVVMEPCRIWEPLYESLEEEGIEDSAHQPLAHSPDRGRDDQDRPSGLPKRWPLCSVSKRFLRSSYRTPRPRRCATWFASATSTDVRPTSVLNRAYAH